MTAFDPAIFKRRSRRAWGTAARGYVEAMLAILEPVGKRLVEMADLQPGESVLDVACGPGEPALMAARHMRGHGLVAATDFSTDMLALARHRGARLRVRGVAFAAMDAEALALRAGAFDAALCRFGLMLVPDPERMLAELRRVVRLHGRVALAVWGEADKTPLVSVGRKIIASYFPQAAHPAAPSPYAFGPPGMLERALKAAGFWNIETERMTLGASFASADAVWGAFASGTAMKPLLDEAPRELKAQVRTAVINAAKAFMNPARRRIEMPSEVVLAVAS